MPVDIYNTILYHWKQKLLINHFIVLWNTSHDILLLDPVICNFVKTDLKQKKKKPDVDRLKKTAENT